MELIGSVSSKVLKKTSDYREMRLLSNFSWFNRIQGSVEIIDAARYLEEKLVELSKDNLEVEVLKFGGSTVPEWIGAPTGWIHRRTWVKVGQVELSSTSHPTLPVAHSPPSDGKVNGKAVLIGDWKKREEYEKAKGKVVVSSGNPYIVYRLAMESGALAVLLYSEDLPPQAVPYKSLFINREEAMKFDIPAASIPNYLVKGIDGKEVSLFLDSDLKKDPGFPYIVAWIGDRNSKGPAVIAHMCHPSPGANDNGSGTISTVESALVLSELIESGELRSPDKTIRFFLFPEYTGSSVVLQRYSGLVTETINLDMVGGRPGGENGPLRLVGSSVSIPSRSAASLYYSLTATSKIMNFGSFSLVGYEGGSDHDVSISYGIPSAMLNQWPDKVYHSDLDDVDRISREMLKLSSSSASISLYELSSLEGINEEVKSYYRELLKEIVYDHASRGEMTSAKLALSLLAERFGIESSQPPSEWKVEGEETIKSNYPMIGSLNFVARKDLDVALSLARIVDGGISMSAYLRELFFLSNSSVKDLYSLIVAEYGERQVKWEDFTNVIKLLSGVGIIEVG